MSDDAAMVVSRDFERALGRAGLDQGRPVALGCTSPSTGPLLWARGTLGPGRDLRPETPMYTASVTKQLIGVLIAQQVLASRLSLDDQVIEVLPMLPIWASPIQIHHLLHHTAGLPTTARLLAAAGVESEQDLTNELVLYGLNRLSRPDIEPGSAFAYSNIGYVLLAEALAASSGSTVPELARKMLFDPLGMTASRLAHESRPHPLTGVRTPETVGDGGWWASAADLLIWLDALNCDYLGSNLTEMVQTRGHLADGTGLDYCWGITARPGRRGTSYTHGGNWPGWSAKTVRQPNTKTAVALLTLDDDVEAVSQAATDLHAMLVAL